MLQKIEEHIHTMDGLMPFINIFEGDVLVHNKWDSQTIKPSHAGSGLPKKSRKFYADSHPGKEGPQGRLQLEVSHALQNLHPEGHQHKNNKATHGLHQPRPPGPALPRNL
jgi:hypothetical protein